MSLDIKHVAGKAVPIYGDEIDTDRIIPARYLKEITFDKMGEYLFYDARFDEAGNALDFPLNDERFKAANIMVVQNNFGCGSSREHAPQAIKRYGIDAIIGESFAEIFLGNCRSLGVPAVMMIRPEINAMMEALEADPNLEVQIDLEAMEVTYGDKVVPIALSDQNRQAFLEGTWNSLAMLNANDAAINETASSLPYFSNFSS